MVRIVPHKKCDLFFPHRFVAKLAFLSASSDSHAGQISSVAKVPEEGTRTETMLATKRSTMCVVQSKVQKKCYQNQIDSLVCDRAHSHVGSERSWFVLFTCSLVSLVCVRSRFEANHNSEMASLSTFADTNPHAGNGKEKLSLDKGFELISLCTNSLCVRRAETDARTRVQADTQCQNYVHSKGKRKQFVQLETWPKGHEHKFVTNHVVGVSEG